MSADAENAASDAAAFIAARMPVSAAPSVPEVRLHLAEPSSGLHRFLTAQAQGADTEPGAPYWAYVWGGGAALARHILDHPEVVAGKRVLDLGAGGGVVAIAAARSGAAAVLASEIDGNGRAALAVNAVLNGVAVTILGDLLDGDPPAADLILVGDLFYAPELARRVIPFLDRALAEGVEVLVGDPGRSYLPRERLALIAGHLTPDFGDREGRTAKRAGVYRFAGAGQPRPFSSTTGP